MTLVNYYIYIYLDGNERFFVRKYINHLIFTFPVCTFTSSWKSINKIELMSSRITIISRVPDCSTLYDIYIYILMSCAIHSMFCHCREFSGDYKLRKRREIIGARLLVYSTYTIENWNCSKMFQQRNGENTFSPKFVLRIILYRISHGHDCYSQTKEAIEHGIFQPPRTIVNIQ